MIGPITAHFSGGGLHGILGPNGSGKSTLLKCICRIWDPSAGQVLWKGKDLHKRERRELSSLVTMFMQDPSPPGVFSVWDIVEMGLYARGSGKLTKKEEKRQIEQALELTETLPLAEACISEISAGEKQRVYLARALSTDAELILLDEPCSNLDI